MIIYNYWPERTGGAESQCRKLVKVLTGKGHSVMVLTGRHNLQIPGREDDNGVEIFRFPVFDSLLKYLLGRGDESARAIGTQYTKQEVHIDKVASAQSGRFRNLIANCAAYIVRYLNIVFFSLSLLLFIGRNRKGISILHVHTADWIAGITALAGKLFKIPVVCKGADTPVFPPLDCVPFPAFIDRMRKKPVFIALTAGMVEDLERNGVVAKKINTIPNGVEIPVHKSDTETNSAFLLLGNFSQSAAHKGFDIILKSWARVVKEDPQARLILAGGGDFSEWSQFAKSLGISKNVEFPGYIEDVAELFLRVCCLVLPSRKEGLSNALLEAQSYGLPAIVSDIPGNREVVLDGKTGIIVPVGDSNAMSEAILTLYRNPELRAVYGGAAKNRIEEGFSIGSVASKIENLYKHLLG